MSGIDYFDRGWRLVGDGPFLTNGETGETLSYDEVRDLTFHAANGLHTEGFKPGDKGAVLSLNDSHAFVCSLGLLRAGLAWIPINPRNSVADNAQILDRFDCSVLFYLSPFAEAVDEIRAQAPGIKNTSASTPPPPPPRAGIRDFSNGQTPIPPTRSRFPTTLTASSRCSPPAAPPICPRAC